jgi:hypothetical protein
VGHVSRRGQINAYKILVGKTKGNTEFLFIPPDLQTFFDYSIVISNHTFILSDKYPQIFFSRLNSGFLALTNK